MKFPTILFALSVLGVAAIAQNTRPAPKVTKPTLAPEPPAAAVPAAPAPAPPASAPVDPVVEGESPEKTMMRFFSALQRKEVDAGYDQLTKGTKIAERAEDVKMLKSKTKDAISVFGVMSGFELVNKKSVTERLMSYTYISLGKEFPLRWRFYFYKPQENWKLIDLRVDDRLAAIFDEPEEPRTREP
jgi:hypothetical protein